MLNKIKNGKLLFPDRKKYNFKYSEEIEDLIKKLLTVDQNTRLGGKEDQIEILAHPAFE